FRLLRHRYAGARQAIGGDPRPRRHAPFHRRGFACLPVGRGHLPRHGLRAARRAAAAIYRPLLYGRLSDRADRPDRAGGLATPLVAARRGELTRSVTSGAHAAAPKLTFI